MKISEVFFSTLLYGEQPESGEHLRMQIVDFDPYKSSIGIVPDNIIGSFGISNIPLTGNPQTGYTSPQNNLIDLENVSTHANQ